MVKVVKNNFSYSSCTRFTLWKKNKIYCKTI